MAFLSTLFDFPLLALLGLLPFIGALVPKRWLPVGGNRRALRAQMALLAAALLLAAIPHLPQTVQPAVHTLLLIDISKSVEEHGLGKSEQEIKQLLTHHQLYYRELVAQYAIMVFAGKTKVIQPWRALADWTGEGITLAHDAGLAPKTTDLAGARYLHAQGKPEDRRQLVLLSDGNDTHYARALPDAVIESLAGIELDMRILRPEKRGQWQWFEQFTMPNVARIKEPFDIFFTVGTDMREPKMARLRVKIDGKARTFTQNPQETVIERPVMPYPFETPITLPGLGEEIREVGYHLYEVELLMPSTAATAAQQAAMATGKSNTQGAPQDAEQELVVIDRRTQVVKFVHSAQVLLVAARDKLLGGGNANAASASPTSSGGTPPPNNASAPLAILESRLSALELDLKKIPMGEFDGKNPGDYDLIILYDLPGNFFTTKRITALKGHVAQRAGGLLLVGGMRSFDFGGYADNQQLTEFLPVEVKPKASRLKAGIFIFLLDVSGSMGGKKLEVLKQSMLNTLQAIPKNGQSQVAIYFFSNSRQKIIRRKSNKLQS